MKARQLVTLEVTWDTMCDDEDEPCDCEINRPEDWIWQEIYRVASNTGEVADIDEHSIEITTIHVSPASEA